MLQPVYWLAVLLPVAIIGLAELFIQAVKVCSSLSLTPTVQITICTSESPLAPLTHFIMPPLTHFLLMPPLTHFLMPPLHFLLMPPHLLHVPALLRIFS
jgi:hypothetical protein